jgi:hypothetical protein
LPTGNNTDGHLLHNAGILRKILAYNLLIRYERLAAAA